MRFTNKDGTICYWWDKRNEPEEIHKQELANQKLCALEDIEDELDIPLTILFKALKDGVYVKLTKGIRKRRVHSLKYDKGYKVLVWKYRTIYFKDYGKSWALTKEELL